MPAPNFDDTIRWMWSTWKDELLADLRLIALTIPSVIRRGILMVAQRLLRVGRAPGTGEQAPARA
jgi:hypothetical protein